MILQGKLVKLRGIEYEDLIARLRWLNDPEITRFFTNLGAMPLTEKELSHWYECLGERQHQEVHFAVDTVTSEHIGGAQLKAIDWRNRSAELGLFIGNTQYWGQGLGTEIVQLLINYGFYTLNLNRIWLRVDIENTGAIRCYQKAGLSEEGVFREEVYSQGHYHDSVIMSILRREIEDGLS